MSSWSCPGIQDGFNRKGLVSEKGEKKLAFEVLRKFYSGTSRDWQIKKGK